MSRLDDILLFLGRLSFAALFVPDGLSKIEGFARFAAGLGNRGLPYPEVWAVLAIIAEIGGPILIVLGVQLRVGILLLIGFCLVATALSHRYWELSEIAERRTQLLSFYKNLALCGGLLFLWVSGPGNLSLERRFAPSPKRRMFGPAE
jgi:putative oxidoreductase